MAVVRLQSRDEVRARVAELRPLTIADDSSDMNRLLDEAAGGCDQLLASTVAEVDGRVVGWASAEQFRGKVVAGVFVHPDNRCQGLGSKLVTMLLEELDRLRPGVRPKTGPERFWRRFLVNPLKPPVYIRRMGNLTDRLRTMLRDKEEPRLWTDTDLNACLQRATNDIAEIAGPPNAAPSDLASTYPASRSVLITGGMVYALLLIVEEATPTEGGWLFRGAVIPDDDQPPTVRHAHTYETALLHSMEQYERSLEKIAEVFGIIQAAKAS